MRRVALIYNPASGLDSLRRLAVIEDAVDVLRHLGIDAEAIATTAPGSAAEQAADAVRRGCDTILACGGDGTVHEVMQGIVPGETALGVIPLGTANALAADLGLPFAPLKALEMLLTAEASRIPAGRITYRDSTGAECSRYFMVAAGIGADADLMYRMDAKLKRRLGYALYAVEGIKILATHPFPMFEARFQTGNGGKPRVEQVSQILAVRIRNFGGLMHKLAPGASLYSESLRLVAFKTRNRWDYLRFLLEVVRKSKRYSGKVELLDAITVECRPRKGSDARVYVEADGEVLGSLPVRIDIVPDAVTLLFPRKVKT